jgi:hypothetical protein
VNDLSRDPIALLLASRDLVSQAGVFGPGHEESVGLLGGLLHVGSGLGKQIEYLGLRREGTKGCASPPPRV